MSNSSLFCFVETAQMQLADANLRVFVMMKLNEMGEKTIDN